MKCIMMSTRGWGRNCLIVQRLTSAGWMDGKMGHVTDNNNIMKLFQQTINIIISKSLV